LGERAEDVLEDASVTVVVELVGGVDPAEHAEGAGAAVLARRGDLEALAGLESFGDATDAEGLAAGQPQALRVLAALELQREHAHAHQVAAVDALEALGDDRLHAEQQGALGRPVTAGA